MKKIVNLRSGFVRSGLTACVLGLAAMTVTATTASAEIKARQLEVVGGNGSTPFWNDYEKVFWEKTIPEATGGKITANAVPYTELGLSGFETLRLLRLGTYDVGTPTLASTVSESHELEGLELPGTISDIENWREVYRAYRSVIDSEMQQKFNAKVLMMYPWPGLDIWCKFDDKAGGPITLDDLKGKKIRAFSTPTGDFIEGLGATPITMSSGEVATSLQRGQLDCAITAQIFAWSSKLYQVLTHQVGINAGFSSGVMAINFDTWNELGEEAQAIIQAEADKLEEAMFEGSKMLGDRADQCLQNGPCDDGKPGGLVLFEPSEEEAGKLRQIAQDTVVKRWAGRCGSEKCVADWNDSIGPLTGITASAD